MSAPQTPPRRNKRPGTTARPFSIRLTEDERRLLLERSGKQPLATYLRDLILGAASQAPRQRSVSKVQDGEALARVLAALGQSRIASNLNQLAKAVNIGVLPVTPETDRDISEACSAIIAMRRDLMRALGIAEGGRP